MAVNKVVVNGQVLIDLTGDTVTADKIISGLKAHTADGKAVVGSLFEGFPEEQTICCAACDSGDDSLLSVNKVVVNGKTIIDLTEDTVTADRIISGFKAHTADGKVVIGTLFEGYPEEQTFFCVTHDSEGNVVKDSSGNAIETRVVYRRSDSSGDGFVYRRV